MATRREMLQTLMASMAGGMVVPGLTAEHPIGRHTADALALEQADAKARNGSSEPAFFDRHQFETLEMLAERIVPGSTRANVVAFIDQLLAVDTADDQRSFLTALGVLEGEARARANRPWKELTEADQIAILTSASTMASGRPPARVWAKGDSVVVEEAAPQTPTLTLRDDFDLLKGWIAGAYYSSEIGMRELGWTGNMFYREYPGCQHADGHL